MTRRLHAAKRVLRFVALLFACGVLFLMQNSAHAERVRLVLQWHHQSQFAGYYMAHARGLYTKHGLQVEILRGGPDVRASEMLRNGEAEFCSTMLSTALELRDETLPLVLLSQIVNRGNFVLIAWRDTPENGEITNLGNLNGRKVTVWKDDFRTPYLALFDSKGVSPRVVPQYYTLSLFLHRGAAACSAMRYNEYHTLLQSGIKPEDLVVFDLHEEGIRLPEDGIYCLNETWKSQPELCRRFVAASLEGWEYARDNRDESLDVVMEYVNRDNLPTNRMHMAWMLREILASIFPGEKSDWVAGRLSRKSYEQSLGILKKHGGLATAPGYEGFVTEDARDVAR